MAYEIPGFKYTLVSEGNILQFTAVQVTADGGCEEAAQNANPIAGIAQMPAEAANPEAITIMQSGVSFALAAGAITAGNRVRVSDDDGRLEEEDTNSIGIALTSCTARNEMVAVLLIPRAHVV